jgi:glycosyltransferase involved in cell wall biosynthesis
MDHCLQSLLPGGEDTEIILIDDGSTDDTPAICDRYAAQYPERIKVIHQENGGHGEGINQGLKFAQGLYFKVVDSDDWADIPSLHNVVNFLRENIKSPEMVDLLICNYVYESMADFSHKAIRYTNVFPKNRVFTWQDTKPFRPSQYILMHSVFYRTELLRDCRLELPKHMFYVDNLFVFLPMPFVKKIYYINTDFYRYSTGRANQSVNEKNMINRIDQQLFVTKQMIESFNIYSKNKADPRLIRYMGSYLSMMLGISSVLLLIDGGEVSLERRNELWDFLYKIDPWLYKKMKYRAVSAITALPGTTGRKIAISVYRMAKNIYRFN